MSDGSDDSDSDPVATHAEPRRLPFSQFRSQKRKWQTPQRTNPNMVPGGDVDIDHEEILRELGLDLGTPPRTKLKRPRPTAARADPRPAQAADDLLSAGIQVSQLRMHSCPGFRAVAMDVHVPATPTPPEATTEAISVHVAADPETHARANIDEETIEETQLQDKVSASDEPMWIAISVKYWGKTEKGHRYHVRWTEEGSNKDRSSWESWQWCVSQWGQQLMKGCRDRGNGPKTPVTKIIGARTRSATRRAARGAAAATHGQGRIVLGRGDRVKGNEEDGGKLITHWGRQEALVVFKSPVALALSTPGEIPGETIRFRSDDHGCVQLALFNLCHYRGRALPKKERRRVRTALANQGRLAFSSLKELAKLAKQNLWELVRAGPGNEADTADWLFSQIEGCFLVEDRSHCVGVDCSARVVLDCGRMRPLSITRRETWLREAGLRANELRVYQLVFGVGVGKSERLTRRVRVPKSAKSHSGQTQVSAWP
jgi:hypothetical protein